MTPEKSSPSVSVKYLNGDTVLKKIQDASKILRQDPNVVKIYLFGSFVREEYVPGSDADVCIVLKEDARRIIDRIPDFLDYFSDVGVPVDIFPYTMQEFQRMRQSENNFVDEITEKGIEL